MIIKLNRIFILLVLPIILGCSSVESPVVKPDKARINDTKLIDNNSESISKISTQTTSENQKSDPAKLHFEHYTKTMLIELACGFYHDSYNKMPESLEDILNGFMLIWPVNVYSGGPILNLNSPPDPKNRKDIGNVYYNKINDHEAEIQYLGPSAHSAQDSTEWGIKTTAVFSDSAKYLLKSDEKESSFSEQFGAKICSKKPKERERFGYKVNLRQGLNLLVYGSLARIGTLYNTFDEVLTGCEYYVLTEGLTDLKKTAKSGDLNFSLGKFKDGTVFYHCQDYYEERKLICSRVNPNVEEGGGVKLSVKCPEITDAKITVFDSENISTIEIAAELMISKEDILQSI